MTKNKLVRVVKLVEVDGLTVSAACREVGISRTTFYNHRDRLTTDARVRALRDKNEQLVDKDVDKILDTQKERTVDLGILNHLLGQLVGGIEEGTWTSHDVESRLVRLVDAKQRVLGGVDRANQIVDSLTLIDARNVTVEDIPEDVRKSVTEDVCEDIWKYLCEGCKEIITMEVKGETGP